MKRRTLITSAVGIALLAAVGAVGVQISEQQIVAGIRRRLSFLKFDDAGLHRFARDYEGVYLQKRPSWNRWKYHFHQLFTKPTAAWGISNDTRTGKERLQDNIATLFLLSSDFFANGADESRTIQYVSFYNPMVACNDWFARPAVTPDAS